MQEKIGDTVFRCGQAFRVVEDRRVGCNALYMDYPYTPKEGCVVKIEKALLEISSGVIYFEPRTFDTEWGKYDVTAPEHEFLFD